MSFWDGWYTSATNAVSGTVQAAESTVASLFKNPTDVTNQSVDPADEAKYGAGVTSETVRILKQSGTEPLIPVTVYDNNAPADSGSAAVAAAWARWAESAASVVKPILQPVAGFLQSTLTKVLIGTVIIVIGLVVLYGLSRRA